MCDTVNSPALMNVKNAKPHAAQSMVFSKVTGGLDQMECILLSRSGVIGRRFLRERCGDSLWMPFSKYVSLGYGHTEGSGNPAII